MASDLCLACSAPNSQKLESAANLPSLSELSDNAKRSINQSINNLYLYTISI